MNYYLKDLSAVGCGFLVTGVKKEYITKSYVTGELYFNGKKLPALAVTYKNGKPAKLIDVLGPTHEQAYKNFKSVSDYMAQCIANNVNGIYSIIKRRFFYRILRFFTTFLLFGTCIFCVYSFLLNNMHPSHLPIVVSSFILEFICFIYNRHTISKY